VSVFWFARCRNEYIQSGTIFPAHISDGAPWHRAPMRRYVTDTIISDVIIKCVAVSLVVERACLSRSLAPCQNYYMGLISLRTEASTHSTAQCMRTEPCWCWQAILLNATWSWRHDVVVFNRCSIGRCIHDGKYTTSRSYSLIGVAPDPRRVCRLILIPFDKQRQSQNRSFPVMCL